MKKAMHMLLWTVDVQEEHYPLFGQLKQMGFDAVEVPIIAGDEAGYKKMAQAITDAGLECSTLAFTVADTNPATTDPKIRQTCLDYLKWTADMSCILDSKMIAGPFYGPHGDFTRPAPLDEEKQRSAEVLKEYAQYAAKSGIRLGIEPLNRFETYFLNTAADAKKFVDLVGEDNLGVLYDTHHANIEENSVIEAIKCLGDSLFHVHFSESHRGELGTGQVDWSSNVKALKEVGYDDWITFECFSDDVEILSDAAHVWRKAFTTKPEVCQRAVDFVNGWFPRTQVAAAGK